jgi:hypothetical protein
MSYLDYLRFFPAAQREVDNLPQFVPLNSIMVMDIKDEPELADYQFYLNNDPLIIPTIIILYYQWINRPREGEIIDFANRITNKNDKNIIIDLIKNYISRHISNLSKEVGEIRDPSNEELVEQKESGVELQVRPVEPEPEGPIIDVNLMPVSARVISNEEKINDEYLPIATKIKVGGKTKKRINKYKKGKSKTNKTNKTLNKKSKKSINSKKYKKNRKTMRKKT